MNRQFLFHAAFLFSTLLFSQNLHGQTDKKPAREILDYTTIWLELGGHGAFYNLAVEQILIDDVHKLSCQIGASWYPESTDVIPLWVPMTVNSLWALDKQKHYLEFGVGIMLNDDGITNIDGSREANYKLDDIIGRFGYRYRNPEKKWDFRISFTPIFQDIPFGRRFSFKREFLNEMIPMAGIAIGRKL